MAVQSSGNFSTKMVRLDFDGTLYQNLTSFLGNCSGDVAIPVMSLEGMERNLEGQGKILFLQFLRKMLKWMPEERMSAFDLLDDPWLNS